MAIFLVSAVIGTFLYPVTGKLVIPPFSFGKWLRPASVITLLSKLFGSVVYKRKYNAASAIKMLSGIAASAVICSMFLGIYKENKPVNYTKQDMAFTDNIKLECSDKNVFDAYRCFIKEYANSTPSYIKKYFSQHKNQEL